MSQEIYNHSKSKIFLKFFSSFGLVLIILLSLYLLNMSSINQFWVVILAIFSFLIAFGFFAVFFSQFTAPVTTMEQRLILFWQFIQFVYGSSKRLVIAKNGELSALFTPHSKNPASMVWLDSASAAVIEKINGEKQVAASNLIFLSPKDQIKGIADLYVHSLMMGPFPTENLFQTSRSKESTKDYIESSRRLKETIAYTSDGQPISVTLWIEFKVQNNKSSLNSFGFDPLAVEKALIQKKTAGIEFKPWIDWKVLAPSLAIKCWRDAISKFTFAQLVENKTGTYLIGTIISELRHRMMRSTFTTGPESERLISNEFLQFSERGIKVISFDITNLRFPESLEFEWASKWNDTFHDQKIKTEKTIYELVSSINRSAKRTAVMDYAYNLARFINSGTINPAHNSNEILYRIIKGELFLVRHDPQLVNYCEKEYQQLTNLLDWLENQTSAQNGKHDD